MSIPVPDFSPNRVLREVATPPVYPLSGIGDAHARHAAMLLPPLLNFFREDHRDEQTAYAAIMNDAGLRAEASSAWILPLEHLKEEEEGASQFEVAALVGGTARVPGRNHVCFRGYSRAFSSELWIPDLALLVGRFVIYPPVEDREWLCGGMLQCHARGRALSPDARCALALALQISSKQSEQALRALAWALYLDRAVRNDAPDELCESARRNLAECSAKIAPTGFLESVEDALPLTRAAYQGLCDLLALGPEASDCAASRWERYDQSGYKDVESFRFPSCPAVRVECAADVDPAIKRPHWSLTRKDIGALSDAFPFLAEEDMFRGPVDLGRVREILTGLSLIAAELDGRDGLWEEFARMAQDYEARLFAGEVL